MQVNEVGFFESLSGVGWLGILIWVIFISLLIRKREWFLNYEERKPRLNIFDGYLYEEWHYILFMIVRFVMIVIILSVVTKIMFQI